MRFIPAYGDPYTPDEVSALTAEDRYIDDAHDLRMFRANDDYMEEEYETCRNDADNL